MYNIFIKSAMHLKSEPDDYHLLRENGQPAYNFVHFLTPVTIVLCDCEYIVNKDACIIYTPKTRQEYQALPGGFTNNFVTFTTDEPDFLARYDLPGNEIFYTGCGEEVINIVEYISWALVDFQLDHQRDLANHLHLLLHTLSKHLISDSAKNQRLFQTRKRFIDLRDKIRISPKGWNIDKMAKAVFLTRSRFSILYKEFFGVSPGVDLIDMTISYAKKALVNPNVSVKEVAENCGYNSVEHFIRLFQKKVGTTPGKYKKENLSSSTIIPK